MGCGVGLLIGVFVLNGFAFVCTFALIHADQDPSDLWRTIMTAVCYMNRKKRKSSSSVYFDPGNPIF